MDSFSAPLKEQIVAPIVDIPMGATASHEYSRAPIVDIPMGATASHEYSRAPIVEDLDESSDVPTVEEPDESNEVNSVNQVLVIILRTDARSLSSIRNTESIDHLKWAFSDPYFIVQVHKINSPRNIPSQQFLNREQFLENYSMREALTYAGEGPYVLNKTALTPQQHWHDLPCIIIKDSGIRVDRSVPTAQGMKQRIKTALERAPQVDLFFLSRWDVTPSIPTHDNIQAIMYTPTSRERVKNGIITAKISLSDYIRHHITDGELVATFFTPHIIDTPPPLPTPEIEEPIPTLRVAPAPTNSNRTMLVIWSIIIIVVVILVAWVIQQLLRTPSRAY